MGRRTGGHVRRRVGTGTAGIAGFRRPKSPVSGLTCARASCAGETRLLPAPGAKAGVEKTANPFIIIFFFNVQLPNHEPQHLLISLKNDALVTKMVNSLSGAPHTKEEPAFEGRAFILFKHVLKLSTSTQHQGLLLLE